MKPSHLAGAAVFAGSALALGACFSLHSDVPSGRDSGGDLAPGDAADASPATGDGCDFYVDHSADAGAGSFRTIGAAVAAAQGSSCGTSATVRVGPGTYSAATGETFPIEVRGISIVGAGQDMTTITGAGRVNVGLPVISWGSLSKGGVVEGTFLVGDIVAPTSIADLSIDAPHPIGDAGSVMTTETFEGIVCDRGNASATPPAPNTTINRVTMHGFDAAVRVTWSRPPAPQSGCNALIVSSTLRDGWFGVIADGDGYDTAPKQLVSLHVGDSPTDGNQLLNFDFTAANVILGGAGVVIGDGVTGAVIRGNTFTQEPGHVDDFGIWIDQKYYDPIGTDIEDNTIGPLLNEGVGLMGNAAVKSFVNNTVQGVSMLGHPQYGWLGIGLAVGVDSFQGSPFVAHARNNTFVGNDVGVELRSTTDPLPTGPSGQNDFGTATSPGGNAFRCNSMAGTDTGSGGGEGGDVWVYMVEPGPTPVVVVPFEGNLWDHAPPTTFLSSDVGTIPHGVDVFEYALPSGVDSGGPLQPAGGTLDTAGAKIASTACPAGRVPGP